MMSKNVTRRSMITTAGLSMTAAVATPLLNSPAKASNNIEWKMLTSWPKGAPGVGTTAQRLADRITSMSGGRLHVKLYAGGELVPPLEVFDAVSSGQAEMAHTASFFWQGKTKSSVFFTTVPFGLTAAEHMAWINHGGGQDLWNEVYEPFGIRPFMAGNTGIQMGGWFKKEIQSLDDLAGVKIRAAGLGGEIYKKLGAAPIFLPPSDIYPSLQSGVVDAAEFLGPWSDRSFGFHKAAPYYYWPSFNKPNGSAECLVNQNAYESLPSDLQEIVRNACEAENAFALSESDWQNALALENLAHEKAVKLRQFPEEVLQKAKNISTNVMDDFVEGDVLASKILSSYRVALSHSREWANVSRKPFMAAR